MPSYQDLKERRLIKLDKILVKPIDDAVKKLAVSSYHGKPKPAHHNMVTVCPHCHLIAPSTIKDGDECPNCGEIIEFAIMQDCVVTEK